MTAAAQIRRLLVRLSRPAILLLCLLGLFNANVALAADQMADMSVISAALMGEDTAGCDDGRLVAADDAGDPAAPKPGDHCQSCCFHLHSQIAPRLSAVEAPRLPDPFAPIGGVPADLHSAFVASPDQPPQA